MVAETEPVLRLVCLVAGVLLPPVPQRRGHPAV
jgi:hypothetical protein